MFLLLQKLFKTTNKDHFNGKVCIVRTASCYMIIFSYLGTASLWIELTFIIINNSREKVILKRSVTCCLFLAYFLYYLWQQESANIFTVLECSNKFLFWLIKLWCFFNHKNWKRQQIIAIIWYFVGFAKTLNKYKRNNFPISKFLSEKDKFHQFEFVIILLVYCCISSQLLTSPDRRHHVVITTTREVFRRGLAGCWRQTVKYTSPLAHRVAEFYQVLSSVGGDWRMTQLINLILMPKVKVST